MKRIDLESQIKSVRVPERDEEFFRDLPQRVLARAQAAPEPSPLPRSFSFSLFAIQTSKFVFPAVVLGFCLWQSRMPQAAFRALQEDRQEVRVALAQVHSSLDTLMRDEHGLHYLVQDQP
jgi:hypothetical protein